MPKVKCPFCDPKIRESQLILSTNSFLLLTNINPLCPGHSLIVSKKHIQTETNLTDYQDYGRIIYRANAYLKEKYGYTPVTYMNNPESFSVKHWHRHLIPYPFKPHDIEQALRKITKT